MNYIYEFFLRANLQQIGAFLLHGVGGDTDPRSYQEREESARRRVAARLHTECPDEAEYERLMGFVYEYVSAVEAVSIELGLQAGAILTAQVCRSLQKALGET